MFVPPLEDFLVEVGLCLGILDLGNVGECEWWATDCRVPDVACDDIFIPGFVGH